MTMRQTFLTIVSASSSSAWVVLVLMRVHEIWGRGGRSGTDHFQLLHEALCSAALADVFEDEVDEFLFLHAEILCCGD